VCTGLDRAVQLDIHPSAHLRLGAGAGAFLLDARRGFEMLRDAAEGHLARPHDLVAYDPTYKGQDFPLPADVPLYDPANATHEIVRTHLIDPDALDADDPALDYFALLGLIS
jgi:hypothetical protein